MNKGHPVEDKFPGFSALKGNLEADCISDGTKRKVWVNGIYVDNIAAKADETSAFGLKQRFRPTGEIEEGFYLLAPKMTDSLVLLPSTLHSSLECIRPRDDGPQLLSGAYRAAALSACFMVIDYASRELLDVDPGEFQILEPRVKRKVDGSLGPFMQISDNLVNGSGLCNRLNQLGSTGEPIILEVIRKILSGTASSPLASLLEKDHREMCLTGCYRCLHRYGNQTYHGLLDWRLGLTVLQIFLDEHHSAGIDGNFTAPGVADWSVIARQLAGEAADLLGRRRTVIGTISLVEFAKEKWAAVIHPLWSWNALLNANPELQDFRSSVESVVPITTFDLSRRMGDVLLKLRSS